MGQFRPNLLFGIRDLCKIRRLIIEHCTPLCMLSRQGNVESHVDFFIRLHFFFDELVVKSNYDQGAFALWEDLHPNAYR